uniref:Uncharacterized protein n=1 Tax=Arundo donax TaxID=35708 RepID=A0A0A9FBG5_ARUDO
MALLVLQLQLRWLVWSDFCITRMMQLSRRRGRRCLTRARQRGG